MIFESFPVGSFQCNCVILGDEGTREAVVIDPGDEIELIRDALKQHKLTPKMTLHTHGHLDHIGAAGDLQEEHGAVLRIHEGDLPLWRGFRLQASMFGMRARDLPEPGSFLKGGDVVTVGSVSLEVLETPGHTPGSICFLLKGAAPRSSGPILFSGDTLFWKGIGRTDLWGGDYRAILGSIRERIFSLPGETVVHPGHGPQTSVSDERRSNPFLPDIIAAR